MKKLLLSIFAILCFALPAYAGTISVTWTDNSTNEDGFRIERKIGTGAYAVIGAVAANVNKYSDTTASDSENNCYRVLAFNAAGVSPYSNEACKSLLQSPSAPSAVTLSSVDSIPPVASTACDATLYPCNSANTRMVTVTPADLQPALTAAQPGDTIQLRTGTYPGATSPPCTGVGGGAYCLTASGTQSQPIWITKFPGDSPVITAAFYNYGAWIAFVGLESNRAPNGLQMYFDPDPKGGQHAQHILIRDNNFHDASYMGIYTNTVSYLLIENNRLSRNGLGPTGCDFSQGGTPTGQWAVHCHGIYMANSPGGPGTTNVIFRRNLCVENTGSCMQNRMDGDKTVGLIAENNVMVNNSSGLNFSDCQSCIARNNTVFMASYPMVISNADERCFVMNHLPGTILANNVCYIPMDSNSTLDGSPNVIYPLNVINLDATNPGTTYTHNAFYLVAGIPWVWPIEGVSGRLLIGYPSTKDPAPVLTAITAKSTGSEAGFVNARAGDFHLAANSPLIGAGDPALCALDNFDGQPRIGCNIGAF